MEFIREPTRTERWIVRIMPAENWWATYRDDDGTKFASRLAAWALVEQRAGRNDVERVVVGLDVSDAKTLELVDEMSNFHRYVYGLTYESLDLRETPHAEAA